MMDERQPDLELISFDLCPYVQRAVIVLNEKGIDYRRTSIDLADKPEWFMQLSPLGKVPILRHGGAVVFESTAIIEYLDEITEPHLHPADPLARALNRAWMEFANTLTNASFNHAVAGTLADAEAAEQQLSALLAQLESAFGEGPYFNGEQLALVDIAFAPVLVRLKHLSSVALGLDLLACCPKLQAWSARLLARDSVRQSIPENYAQTAAERFARRGSWLAQQYLALGASEQAAGDD